MYHRLFLVALLSSAVGESRVHGPPEKVLAFAGSDVILPCSFNITASDDFPTVEWSKEGLKPNVIFLYRDGCETYEMKNPAFEYRTSLIMKELKNRNISLRISNVQLSDAGKYQCMRLWKNAPRDITTVELVVGEASEPKLSVISDESGGVTLQCEANCGLLKPEIEFLDDQGNYIRAHETKIDQDGRGCNTVTRRVTLQDITNRVTCRVHQPEINQTRNTDILIPVDCMRSCFLIIGIAVGEAVLLASFGLAVLLWKICGKSAEGQKLPVTRQSSDQSTKSGTSENLLLLKSNVADNVGNSTTKKLTREAADLKSKLYEKEETICQLQKFHKAQLHEKEETICQLQKCHKAQLHEKEETICQLQKFHKAQLHEKEETICQLQKCHKAQLHEKEETICQLQKSIKSQLSPVVCHQGQPTIVYSHEASTNINPPQSGNLPENQGPKPVISRQNSDPTSGCPFHRVRRSSSPALLTFDVAVSSSSSSTSTSEKKLSHIGRSMSESHAPPGPSATKLQRRHSLVFPPPTLSTNRFLPLAGLTEESEQLMPREKSTKLKTKK